MSKDDAVLLEPLLVVELGDRIGVGALGGLLSQLGADTVAVEPAERRTTGKWRNRSLAMAGKRSIVIDAEMVQGQDERRRLVASADIVLISSDVDPADIAIWDGLRPTQQIICDLTAFGHSGPLAGTSLPEAFVQAVSGLVDTTGPQERPPCVIGGSLLEMHAAVLAASAIVAALRVRRLRHLGQRIDVALFDVGVTALINFVPLYITGLASSRCGNRHPLYAAWGSFPAKDGWILICAAMDDHWVRLCEVMRRPELATHAEFLTTSARLRSVKPITEIVSAWTSQLTVVECERRLIEAGISCGPIVDISQLEDQANMRFRGAIEELKDSEGGVMIKAHMSPLRGAPVGGRKPTSPPKRDQDRATILRSLHPLRGELTQGDPVVGFLPCEGLRIIEIGQYTVAPLPSRMMGAMGADVIKVEPPTGDAVRKAPPLREDGASYIFAMSNTDKRGIVLDLKKADDRETLHRLLDTADALVENLKPGSLAKLGFSSEVLGRRHPSLVYCAVNGFGTNSLYPGRPALDTVVQAMSGIMSLTSVDGVPTKAGISTSDNFGGQFALLALLAGIEFRDRTGTHVHFDLSMQEGSAWATQSEWNVAPRGKELAILSALDGFVVASGTPDDVDSFLRAGQLDLTRLTRVEAIERLSEQFAAYPVNTVGEAISHPQTEARTLFYSCPSADGDAWQVFSLPYKLLSTPGRVRGVISRLGFDTTNVLEGLKSIDTPDLRDPIKLYS